MRKPIVLLLPKGQNYTKTGLHTLDLYILNNLYFNINKTAGL